MPRLSKDSVDAAIDEQERAQREENSLRRRIRALEKENALLEAKVDLLTELDGIKVTPAEWAQPGKPRSGHRAIANLMLSDLHLDEIVDPHEMRGMNAYDRD